jgi:large repetitive protein
MKRFTIILASLFILCSSVFAQQFESHYPARIGGFWSVGINGGFAYQSSDICPTADGFGLGLTVARSAFYRPGALFSYDWRGRLLYDQTYGMDTKRSYGVKYNNALNGAWNPNINYSKSPGFVYANYKTHMAELGIEGVLTLNRLRERTGVVVSVFGGLGLDWYNTLTDQEDINGKPYNYRGIDSTFNVSSTRALLKSTRDGYYETSADGNDSGIGNIRIMPGAGLELGYQFSPRFYAGLSHKITFSRTNVLDGAQWADNNTATIGKDWAHYTSLQMVWELRKRERKIDPPIIEVTVPDTNPYNTQSPTTIVAAIIKNIHEKSQAKMFLNGVLQDFNFNNPRIYQEIRLKNGQNEPKITANNSAGSDSKTIIINYNPNGQVVDNTPVPTQNNRPEIKMLSPDVTPLRTDVQDFTVIASIKYVDRAENVNFWVNGAERRFDFNTRNGELKSNIRLQDGRNEIRIKARNQYGEDMEDGVIILERRTQTQTPTSPVVTPTPPSVRFSLPANNSTSIEPSASVSAMTQNVTNSNQINVLVNGSRIYNIDFNSRNGLVTFNVSLMGGSNSVVINVENKDGKASDALTLKYLAPLEPKKNRPVVEILTPSNGASFSNSFCNMTAKVQNVDRKSDVTVRVNGNPITDFNFSGSKQVSAEIKLNEGNNIISVTGTNASGSDEASINVRYERERRPPSVQITLPSSDISTDIATQTVRATLKNVSSRNEVRMTVNGSTYTTFDFNGDRLDTYLKLKEGNNQVVVSVTNSDGSAQDQVNINYTAPKPVVLPPTVAFIRPAESGSLVSVASYNLVARIKYVASKNNITLTVNNRAINNFSIINGEVRATVTLSNGNNDIRITATNESGNAEDNTSIRFQIPTDDSNTAPTSGGNTGKTRPSTNDDGPSAPTTGTPTTGTPTQGPGKIKALRGAPTMSEIITTVPVQDPSQPMTNTCNVSATLTNIASPEQITMTVNGEIVNNFTLQNGQLTYAFPLVSGKNTIKIVAQNRFGTIEKSASVDF